jgi:murein DD-endopeptidase MepM/ murein hydrolase activator NlpD
MTSNRQTIRRIGVVFGALTLASCSSFDGDFRGIGNGLDTSNAALRATTTRPAPDNRGLISYPTYQVAIAQRGDTVSDVAGRIGVSADELASFNGIRDGVPLRSGETLVLPNQVGPADGVDVAAVAGPAIDRAGSNDGLAAPGTARGLEPQRHRVEPGETAFSISRLYGVTPKSLAEWNGLGPDLELRPGEILLIPVVIEPDVSTGALETTTLPGEGTDTPEPPSAATPLPVEEDTREAAAAPVPASPELAEEKTETARLVLPVKGDIIRAFDGADNKGIDIAAPAGSDVRAADAGTVAAISRDTNGILAVVIRHPDDLLTVYFGVQDEIVAKDATVERGQVIGKVQDGDPPFLHFEVRRGFEPLDPVSFLN